MNLSFVRKHLVTAAAGMSLALAATLGMSAQAQSKTASAPSETLNSYVVELAVMRSGKVVATPKMTVLMGKPARLTIHQDGADGSLRIQVTANPAGKSKNGARTVKIDAVVLEQIGGAWVVLTDPVVHMEESKPASVSIESPVGAIRLDLRATGKYSANAATAKPSQCGELTAPDAVALAGPGDPPLCPSLPCDNQDCCEEACADGSGNKLTCCGALACCGCGACCEP